MNYYWRGRSCIGWFLGGVGCVAVLDFGHHKMNELSPFTEMLFDGVFAYLLAGQQWQQGLICSKVMEDGFAQYDSEFGDGQYQQSAYAFGEYFGLGLIGSQLTDVFEIPMVEVFGVESFEVVHEDIEYFYFFMFLQQRVQGAVAFLFAADVGIDIIDQIQLGVLFQVLHCFWSFRFGLTLPHRLFFHPFLLCSLNADLLFFGWDKRLGWENRFLCFHFYWDWVVVVCRPFGCGFRGEVAGKVGVDGVTEIDGKEGRHEGWLVGVAVIVIIGEGIEIEGCVFS